MKKVSIPVKPENKLNIKASDDLYVEGSDSSIMTAIVRQSDSFRYTESVGKGDVRATSDCWLSVPVPMAVTIEKVGGDASLTNLASRVIVGKVGRPCHSKPRRCIDRSNWRRSACQFPRGRGP